MNTNPDPRWRILVVEDEALLAEEIRDRLEHLGHDVVGVADNGADAIDIARQTCPDLVLMDIRIKGDLDGIETADLIHGELDIPVVFSTAHSDRDTLQQAQITGLFGYIIKPWREQDLVMAIRLAMHRHQTETAARRHHDSNLHSVLETGVHPVILCNAQGRIFAANSNAESIFGYPRGMLAGQPFELLLAEQERTAWSALREQAFTKHASQADDTPTFHVQRRDGLAFPAKVSPTYIETSAGPSLYLIIRDLSEAQMPFDPVTGLPNRGKFREALTEALRPPGGRLALLLLDLDHFKEVNDTLGHEAGDRLLAETARRISGFIGSQCALARLGGDEFALLLPGPRGLCDAECIAQRLVEALSVPFEVDGKPLYLTASAGIATCPDDALSATDLLKYAEQAMYAAKSRGRNRVARFSAEMQDGAQKRRALSDDLHGALQRGEFSLHYQPIIDLSDGGRPSKAEALLRWQHPERGPIPPLDFIPLLEETGLIHEVGEWVFDEASAQAERLARQLGRTIQISVNMSALQLAVHAPGAVDWRAKLAELPPLNGRIGIEITESVLIEDQQRVKGYLLDLRRHGISVSIDDFGTGFSSLSYLKTFSIDFLKIDASFIRGIGHDPNDHALTEAIIVMAHKLGFKTIAEGVETGLQADILEKMGCDCAQGYLFSRPLPMDAFEAYLLQSGR